MWHCTVAEQRLSVSCTGSLHTHTIKAPEPLCYLLNGTERQQHHGAVIASRGARHRA